MRQAHMALLPQNTPVPEDLRTLEGTLSIELGELLALILPGETNRSK